MECVRSCLLLLLLGLSACGGDGPEPPPPATGRQAAAPPAALPRPDLRHMRAVHMASNYGANVQGFKRAIFQPAPSISVGGAQIAVSRSTTNVPGGTMTWDLAAVTLSNVVVSGQTLARAGFWLSRNPNTGQLSLAFNPSLDASLQGVAGFAGDVNLPRSGDGGVVDSSQMSTVTGVARDLILGVVAHGDALVAGASVSVIGPASAGFDLAAIQQGLQSIRSTIDQQEAGARAAYFRFLKETDVEWIEVNIPIFNDSIADPTVKVNYQPAGDISAGVFTFDDADLRDFISDAKGRGFMVALNFEFYPVVLPVATSDPTCQTAQYKPNRWLLGQPSVIPSEWDQVCINPQMWWWNPSHPQHATNVALFWNSYTDVVVKYAAMAQELGVDLFSLGSEQDNLFRTRAGAAPYTNHFRGQLTYMVASVRAAYSGLVTLEQHWQAVAQPQNYGGGAGTADLFAHVFADLGLDVVAVSAYFPLANAVPSAELPVSQLEAAWEDIFQRHLIPLRNANPGKPIIFTEFGYTNDVGSPLIQGSALGAVEPAAGAEVSSPGKRQQQNIFQSFFNVNGRHDDLVQGAFIWGVGFLDPQDCTHVTFGIYCKPAAQTISAIYRQRLLQDIDRLFGWAQVVYPQFFPAASASGTLESSGYTFRYYEQTGNYLAVKDSRVIVHNGSNWNFLDVGAMRPYLDFVGNAGF